MKEIKGENFKVEDLVKTCYGLDEFEIEKLDFNQEKLTLKVYARLPLNKCVCKVHHRT